MDDHISIKVFKDKISAETEKDDTGALRQDIGPASEPSSTKLRRQGTSKHGRSRESLSGRLSSQRRSSSALGAGLTSTTPGSELKSALAAATEASSEDTERAAAVSGTSVEEPSTTVSEGSHLKGDRKQSGADTSKTTPSNARGINAEKGAASTVKSAEGLYTGDWMSADLPGAVGDESSRNQQTGSRFTSGRDWARKSTVTSVASSPKPAEMRGASTSEGSPPTVSSDYSSPATEAVIASSCEMSSGKSKDKSMVKTSEQSKPKSARRTSEGEPVMTSHKPTAKSAEEQGVSSRASLWKSSEKASTASDETVSMVVEERSATSTGTTPRTLTEELAKANEDSTPKPARNRDTRSTATSPWQSAERSAPYDVSVPKTSKKRAANATPKSILKSGRTSEAPSPKATKKRDTVSIGTSPQWSPAMSPTFSEHSDYKSAEDHPTRSIPTSPMRSVETTSKQTEWLCRKVVQQQREGTRPTCHYKSADRAAVSDAKNTGMSPTKRRASGMVTAGKHSGTSRKPSMTSVGTSPIEWHERMPAKSPGRATLNGIVAMHGDALGNRKGDLSPVRERHAEEDTVRVMAVDRMVVAGMLSALALVLSVRMLKVARYTDVVTMEGTLVGMLTRSSQGVPVRRFLGVPYAKSTAGIHRFGMPVPLHKFPGLRHEALAHGLPCTQWRNDSVIGSEDCLSLAIWAPAATEQPARKKPVVVVLTGEWFGTGSNSDYDWTELAALADSVVVSVNHRLGVMGFFKPDSSDAVHDVAFEDLQLAVEWTRRNAAALDGDPDDLMALGLGSGAFMLAVTMISREHRLDFRRMILQGLYPTMPFILTTPSMGRAYLRNIATSLGCQPGDPSALLSCLKRASQERLLKAARDVDVPLRFVPARSEGYRVDEIPFQDVWKFDGDVDVILGSDLSLGEAFNRQYLLPYSASHDNVSDPAHTLRSVCMFLKERECSIRGRTNRTESAESLKGTTEQQLEEDMAHLWTTCASRAMADVAVLKNATVRHYVAANQGALFDPPLTLDDVAAFFRAGAVPPLKSGLPWPVYERGGVSRSALWPNSSEETIAEAADEICDRTRAFAHYLY